VRLFLTHRDFALAWIGSLISLTGDWMLHAALPVYVFQLTGSTLATGLMIVVHVAPSLLFGSVAGVLVDRWDRKRTLVIANVIQTVGLLPLLFVTSAEWVWLVYVVAFSQATLAQVVRPAQGALLPRLVPEDDLVSANSLNALNGNLSRLVGPALGGVMVATLGLGSVALADAATFAVAALLLGMIRTDTRPPARTAQAGDQGMLSMVGDWLDGLRVIRGHPVLCLLFAFTAISSVGEGALFALFAPFVMQVLDGGEVGYGVIVSAQAIGGLIGSVGLAARPRIMSPARLLGLGALGLAVVDLVTFNYYHVVPGILPAIILFAVVGAPIAGMVVGRSTLTQTATTDAYRGRVVGAMMAVAALSSLIGAVVGGALGERVGIVTVLNIQGLGYGLAGLLVLMLLPARQRGAEAGGEAAGSFGARQKTGTLTALDGA
jgi:predicted MFS family arabinose efflux permease